MAGKVPAAALLLGDLRKGFASREMSTFDVKESGQRGTLQINSDSISWSAQASDRSFTVKKKDGVSASWVRTSHKHFQFRVKKTDESIVRFDGFDAKDQKALQNFSNSMGWGFQIEKLDVQGKNAGKFDVVGEDLIFTVYTTNSKGEIVAEKRSFDLPLTQVKNAQANSSKDELLLEFSQGENAAKKNECIMTEMRFYVPNSNEEGDEDDVKRSVEILHGKVSKYVIKEATGAQIAKLEDIKCKYPRNTFEISLYDSVFKMHGQSYDFSIKYKNISRLIMVPSPSNQVYLVICLIEPERKGGTQYSAIVAVFDPDQDMDVSLTLPADFHKRYQYARPSQV